MELPYKDLILPYTGPITDMRPVQGGSGFSTTALVTSGEGEFFVKGVPNRPGGRLDSVVREGLINPALTGIAPTLRWKVEGQPWFVLGFDVVQGRVAEYTPGEDHDLSQVVGLIDRIAAVELPSEAAGWAESRWDRFTDTPNSWPATRSCTPTSSLTTSSSALTDRGLWTGSGRLSGPRS